MRGLNLVSFVFFAKTSTTYGTSSECTLGLTENRYSDTTAPEVSSNTQSPKASFVQDFTRVKEKDGKQYVALKAGCEALGYTLCDVSTEVQYADNTTSSEVVKPICFPDTCATEDVDILDAEPLRCDPLTGCKITQREVMCPDRNFAVGDCAADALTIADDSEITRRMSNLQNEMEGQCLDVLHGKTSRWCSVTTSKDETVETDPPHNIVKDLSALTGNSYQLLESRCGELGGTLCTVDTGVDVSLPSVRLFESGKAICFPPTCSKDDIDILDPTPLLCNADDGDCTITFRNVTCPSPTTVEGDCATDAATFATDADISSRYEVLSRRADAECIGYFLGEKDDVCYYAAKSFMENTYEYTKTMATDAYGDFESTCHAAGNEVCALSATLTYDSRDDYQFMEKSFSHNSFPFCKPDACPNETSQSLAYQVLFDDSPCGTNNTLCDLSVSSLQCFEAPSSSPTLTLSLEPSSSPSSSPDLTVSMEPSSSPPLTVSMEPSSSPTLITSSTPSLVKSSTPNKADTSAPSKPPSKAPTGTTTRDTTSAGVCLRSSGQALAVSSLVLSIWAALT